MILIFSRHGLPDLSNPDEKARPLVAEGKTRQNQLMYKLLEAGYCPDYIYTSPIQRALDSAEVMADRAGTEEIAVIEELASGDKNGLIELINTHGSDEIVLLVGHGPILIDVASTLLGERISIAPFEMSSAIVIDYNKKQKKSKFVGYFKVVV